MPATYVASSAVYNAANPAVVGSSGNTLVGLAWDITAAPAGWTLRVDDSATSGWRVYTKTHTGETGTYAFTGGTTYPTVFIIALSGTSETSYGTPSFTTGNDTTADNPGANGTGVALFGVISFGNITSGSQTNSFVEQQFDPAQFAALATKTVAVASGAVQYTVVASDYRTVVLVMADAASGGGGNNGYTRIGASTQFAPGSRILALTRSRSLVQVPAHARSGFRLSDRPKRRSSHYPVPNFDPPARGRDCSCRYG